MRLQQSVSRSPLERLFHRPDVRRLPFSTNNEKHTFSFLLGKVVAYILRGGRPMSLPKKV